MPTLFYSLQCDAVQVPRPGTIVRLPGNEELFNRVNRGGPGSPVVKEHVAVEVKHQKRLVARPACPVHIARGRLILAGENELTAGRVRRGWCKQASGGKSPSVPHAQHHRYSSNAETDGIMQEPHHNHPRNRLSSGAQSDASAPSADRGRLDLSL